MKYSLAANKLPTIHQGSYKAVVRNRKTIDLSHIVNHIVKEGTCLIRPQVTAHCRKVFRIIAAYLAKGFPVSLPGANTCTIIGGIFNGLECPQGRQL